jgi:PAS domain S-box-containing protein
VIGPVEGSLAVSGLGAIAATLCLIFSLLLYLWTPRKKFFTASISVYLLLAITTGVLIIGTGDVQSSFIALWIAISLFACVFGFWGAIPLLIGVASFEAYLIFSNEAIFPVSSVITTSIAGIAPLIASYIIFHARPKGNTKEDKAFHELTNELTQESNKSSVVIRAINEGVIAVDPKGIIELINPAAQHIIGWGGEDAVGLDYKSVLKLTDKADKSLDPSVDPVVSVLATNQEIHTKDFYTTTNGGKRLILSIVVSPIGQLGEGVLIVFRDITKEQAEEREMAEFISTASHEMRTPVASIEGYLGLALNPATAQIDAKARDFITKAHESARHLGRLFQDLLDVSKAEDGRLSNHPSIVDVVAFIGTVVEGLVPRAQEKQLRLFYKPNPDQATTDQRSLSPVYYANVDNDHLREVVQNLIENAIKYTPKGDVIVDVTGDDTHVRISIQDSGIGIPKEDISHLFQKFYRVDNTATREIGGTGLGLYLCRRLAEVMEGRITVDSEFKKGSTFTLEIPRIDRIEAMKIMESVTELSTPIVTSREIATQNAPNEISTWETSDLQSDELAQPQPQPPLQPTPQQTQSTSAQQSAQTAPPTIASIEQNPAAYTQVRPNTNIAIPNRAYDQNR